MTRAPVTVEFLTRADCALCDAGRGSLVRAARWLGIDVLVVDIDGDPDLRCEFGQRVPVVRDGRRRVLLEGRWSPFRVTTVLLRVRLAAFRR